MESSTSNYVERSMEEPLLKALLVPRSQGEADSSVKLGPRKMADQSEEKGKGTAKETPSGITLILTDPEGCAHRTHFGSKHGRTWYNLENNPQTTHKLNSKGQKSCWLKGLKHNL